ncbi:MAG: DUF2490 domain-containing protein [Bacteroidales bacterium]
MMTRFKSTLILLVLIHAVTLSQTKDFGIWYGANADIQLTNFLDFNLGATIRTFEKAGKVEEGFGEAGLTLKVIKGLSVAAAYRMTSRLEDDNRYYPRHKWFADIKGSFQLAKFDLSGRFRLQRQNKTYWEDANDEIPDYYGRIKLKAEYRTKSFPVNPYVSYETFARMFEITDKRFEKFRYSAGIDYKLNKRHSFELEYIFQRDHAPRLADMNIISIGYNIKL